MTPRECDLLTTIEELTAARGFPPSMRECAAAMKVSLTRIAQLVARCSRQGRLARHPRIARSLVVLSPTPGGEVPCGS
jgi:SOS-response transcriptional repressor LexA